MAKKDDAPKDGQTKVRRGLTTLGQSINRITSPTLRKRGFAEGTIVTRWDESVGRPWCDHTQPFRVVFPKGERRRGTLHMNVSGSFAPDVQHLSPQIIERINSHFGYGAIECIELHQARIEPPIKKRASNKALGEPSGPETELAPQLSDVIKKVEDDSLRTALERLARTRAEEESRTDAKNGDEKPA